MRYSFSFLVIAGLMAHGAIAKESLKVQVYTSQDALAVTSTIISGEHEAIVIDPQFRLSDAHRVAAMVLESRKKLIAVYSTHPHPDHYFGLAVFGPAFPDAKLLALPVVVKGIEASWDNRYEFWKATYSGDIPATHVIPKSLDTDTLIVDGEAIKIIGPVQGDSPGDNSYVWVPSIKALIGGDILFGNMHLPLGIMSKEQRADLLKVIDQMLALQPQIVVPGHEAPGTTHDASILNGMRDYMLYFDTARASSKTPEELSEKLAKRFPKFETGFFNLLKMSSDAAFGKTPQFGPPPGKVEEK